MMKFWGNGKKAVKRKESDGKGPGRKEAKGDDDDDDEEDGWSSGKRAFVQFLRRVSRCFADGLRAWRARLERPHHILFQARTSSSCHDICKLLLSCLCPALQCMKEEQFVSFVMITAACSCAPGLRFLFVRMLLQH